MAATFKTTPSALLRIPDPWLAYCLDEALYARLRVEADRDERGLPPLAAYGRPPARDVLAQLPTLEG